MPQAARTAPHASSADGENVAAQLTARERRALLEDIGHIALTLGRFLLPPKGREEALKPEELTTANSLPASPAAYSRPDALTSPQERLHFLGALWTSVEGALTAIIRQPDTRAVSVQQAMPLARSQGSGSAAAAIARLPRAATAWRQIELANKHNFVPHSPHRAHSPASFSAAPTQPDQTPIEERVTVRAYDTWANRLVVSLLTHIEEEAGALSRLAHFCDATQEAAAADHLVDVARRVRRNSFLRDCPGLRGSEQAQGTGGDSIGRCSVPYRAVYHAWRSLHHPLDFDWSGSPLLYLPALEPWHLYEIWCYLQVAAALLRAGWRLTGSGLLRCTPNGLRLVLATGRESRLCFQKGKGDQKGKGKSEKGKEEAASTSSAQSATPDSSLSPSPFSLSLYYQPLFASANQTARREREQASAKSLQAGDDRDKDGGQDRESRKYKAGNKSEEFAFVSRSHAMQPDIALHWNGGLALLDPKFKRYAEGEDAQEDINKMHAYRDAIVRHSVSDRKGRERGIPPVSAAWCLFPGASAHDAAEVDSKSILYAYPAATPESPFGTAGVGAFLLRPGQPDTTDRLAEFLTALLAAQEDTTE